MQINSLQLKVIACVSMLIDHIGHIFFPKFIVLKLIGHLSFPIFAFLIAEGYTHTKDFKKYLWRIFIFFIISQPIFEYAFQPYKIGTLNIFIDLFFGLVALYLYDNIKNKKCALAVVFLFSITGNIVGLQYGFFGILLIFSFYFYNIKSSFNKLFFVQLALIIAYIFYIKHEYADINITLPIIWLFIQFGFLAPLYLIKYYDGQRGKYSKYLFYAFYPLHILILGFIARIIK